MPAEIARLGAGYKIIFVSDKRNITDEELQQIERFVQLEMEASEATAFSDKMLADKDLRAKVEEVKLMLLAIGEANLQEQLPDFHKTIIAANDKPTGSRTWSVNWKIAASVLFIFALGAWWLYTGSSEQRLYSKYYSPDAGLMTAMSAVNENYEFDKAMVEYKSGAYDKALAAWQKLLIENPGNDTLHYFIGCAWQAKENYTEAKNYLQSVANNTGSAFYKDACWYLGLIYSRRGDKEKAIYYLQLSGHPQSTALINRIK